MIFHLSPADCSTGTLAPGRPGELLRALGVGAGHGQQVLERALFDAAPGGLELEGEELMEGGAADRWQPGFEGPSRVDP
jgi:hypothetical protein